MNLKEKVLSCFFKSCKSQNIAKIILVFAPLRFYFTAKVR